MTITPLKAIAEAAQTAMHSWEFDDLVEGGVEETRIEEKTALNIRIKCTLANGETFRINVTR
ncbi:MAG: hypothetical protein AAGB04_30105 [Pseudomonadota bacterium]